MHVSKTIITTILFLSCAAVGLAQTNGTITFSRKGETDVGTSNVKVSITAKKGATELPQTDGTHTFPGYTKLSAVADYYGPILNSKGFVDGTDYKITDGSIHFYGVSTLDGGSSGAVDVEGTLDKGKFTTLTGIKLTVVRGVAPMSGMVTLTGSALVFSGSSGEFVDSRSSRVTAYFEAGDTAQTMMAKIAAALQSEGWVASSNSGFVVMSTLPGGVPIYSLNMVFQYLPEVPGEELPPATDADDDHWVLERVN